MEATRLRRKKVLEFQPAFKFEIITSPEARTRIFQKVQELIQRVQNEHIDTLVFLDKSARPISWLFRELWGRECADQPMPNVRFINIGRNVESHQQHDSLHQQIAANENIYEHAEGDVNAVEAKNMLQRNAIGIQETAIHEIQKIYNDDFVDQQVLIIDEYMSTGATKVKAAALFAEAFPQAKQIISTHLFSGDEKDYMPWKFIPGATGILELNDSSFYQSQ